ncbi:helix-turn-helix domain-containing protein [Streptomyces sp. NPDC051362]|uniref:helix-turn-helix domain-containing protein n=1 Tax=Streptomyces sp. NPDC051362 TaxID=3365651 RepID=UPI0037AE12BB
MLETVGLTAAEDEVYRLVVAAGRASVEEITGRSTLTASAVQRLLLSLESKGLVSVAEEGSGWFAAVPPEIALVPRLQHHSDALEQARVGVGDLVDIYRRSVPGGGAAEAIEIISGAAALRQHLRELQDAARYEVLWFRTAGYETMFLDSNRQHFEARTRGAQYRVLYEQAYFDGTGSVGNVVRGVRRGEVARLVPRLPLPMAIADRSVAVLPLASSDTLDYRRGLRAALVRGSSLLDVLISLFERHWEAGTPLRVTGEGEIDGAVATESASPSGDDRRVLSLMVAGMTDEEIAGQFRVSKRTIQRRIQRLMTLANAATRMQLGWHAARWDWV